MRNFKQNLVYIFYSCGILSALLIATLNFSLDNLFSRNFYIFLIAPLIIYTAEILSLWLSEFGSLNFLDIFVSKTNKAIVLINTFIGPILLIFSTALYLIIFRHNLYFYILLPINFIIIFLTFKSIRNSIDTQNYKNLLTSEIFDALNIFTIFQFSISFFYRIHNTFFRYEWFTTFFVILLCFAFVVMLKFKLAREVKILSAILLSGLFTLISFVIFYLKFSTINPIVLATYLTFLYYCIVSLIQQRWEDELSLSEGAKYFCFIGIFTAIILLLNFI